MCELVHVEQVVNFYLSRLHFGELGVWAEHLGTGLPRKSLTDLTALRGVALKLSARGKDVASSGMADIFTF
jgi:hypothetical protein